jgi:hypothetical protein
MIFSFSQIISNISNYFSLNIGWEMKIAIITSLFAKWNMNINTRQRM